MVLLVKFAINMVFVVDLLKMFFTGFYDNDRSKTILKPSSIAKKYLRTYFLIDVLTILHAGILLSITLYPEFPLPMSVIYSNEVVVIFGGGLMWIYTMIFQIDISLDQWYDVEIENDFQSMYMTFYSATLMLLNVSYGEKREYFVHDMVASIFIMSVGYALQMFLLTKIFEVCSRRYFNNK
ncbi:hypothetical protein JTB14_027369 [Gonioctena quinquepunctata]|nr:hypothetical protein JTB14_027369 [Gonioctena quinquepunctata]